MISDRELEYMVGYVYLVMDAKITQDLSESKLGYGNNIIESPYGKKYLENIGYSRYGSVEPIRISSIGLNRLIRRKNYEEYIQTKLQSLHTPIDVAYYLMFAAAYTVFMGEGSIRGPDGVPEHQRSLFFSTCAKRYIRIAIQDIINSYGEMITMDDLSKCVYDEIVYYLYLEGTYNMPECLAMDLVDNLSDAWNYPSLLKEEAVENPTKQDTHKTVG